MLNRLPANERRPQLVESALDVAERGGIGAVTIRAVADNAGVSLGVVHYCFENKEALITAMGEYLILQLSSLWREAFSVAHNSSLRGLSGLRQLLYLGLDRMWPTVDAAPDRQLLAYEITAYALRYRAAGPTLAGGIANEQYRIRDVEAMAFLEECAERTGTVWIEPVSAIVRLSLAILDGLVLRWLVDRDSDAIVVELDELARIIAAKAVERA